MFVWTVAAAFVYGFRSLLAVGWGSSGLRLASLSLFHSVREATRGSLMCDDLDGFLSAFKERHLVPLEKTTLGQPNASSTEQFYCVKPSSERFALEGCGECRGPPSVALLFLAKDKVPFGQLWADWLGLASDRRKFTVYLHRHDNATAALHPLFNASLIEPVDTSYGSFILGENALWRAALRDPCNQMMVLLSVTHVPVSHPDVVYDVLFETRSDDMGGLPTSRICYRDHFKQSGPDRREADVVDSIARDPSCQDAESNEGYDRKHMQWRTYNRYHAVLTAAQGVNYPHGELPNWYRPLKSASDEWFPHHVLRRTLGNKAVWKQVNGGLGDWSQQREPHIEELFCDTALCWKNKKDFCGLGTAYQCSKWGPLCFSQLKLGKLKELIRSRHPLFFRKVLPNATMIINSKQREVGLVSEMLLPLIRDNSQHTVQSAVS
ncbi:unnamed protein product [Vitrella brassicaformis CCMP3155]|uniref:Uncharacterized protein n=2 Tax=Vitrella brassicaformis TaxID=1169539 RepID=A0A0G4EUU9_VITBC|nr:unnamed protein product [Vitrella brassicaformis CCMP3155]|eukprot:CEM02375.1 unnamed protein product [Vitrella brassicaformis CCMP3155]